jgi:hypothetical protein
MIDDFRPIIGSIWMLKQKMMETDTNHIWEYHLPEVAATENDLLEAEKHLGHSVDSRYKAFLICANGWRAFYHTVDLFGTSDLYTGERYEVGQFVFGCLEDEVLRNSKLERADLFPIAATQRDRDLFLMGRPQTSIAGQVFWFAGEEVDRFDTFDDYFLSMAEYNKRGLVFLKNQD